MKSLITRFDARDYKLGDGNITLKGGNPDWTGNYWFDEKQKIGGFETDCCVIFGEQESFDAQMDRLIQSNSLPQSLLDWFTLNGYMDSVNSTDGKPHFHTSERFTAYNTGNLYNGNAGQDGWNAMRKFGVIPWSDWPFDGTVTQETYFEKPPQALFDKGLLFLSMIGGKNAIQYHWVYEGSNCPRSLMDSARATAPLCLGIATDGGWNQEFPTPPPMGTAPNHMVDNITSNNGEVIFDHYVPFQKTFGPTYPIPQVIQGVVSLIIAPPLPAPLPPNPTNPQIGNWLTQVSNWIQSIINQLKVGNLGAITMIQAYNLSKFQQSVLDIAVKVGVFAGLTVIDAISSALSSGSLQLPYPTLLLPVLTLILSQLDSYFIAWGKQEDMVLPPPAPTS